MLRSLNKLRNAVLEAMDGDIGRCNDFLFDEDRWTVRYMVADTGKWLPGRKVLISPISLGTPDWDNNHFPVKLSREQIENSPPLESDLPVSRKYEISWFNYFRWPYYWQGPGAWGAVPNPQPLYEQQREKEYDSIDPEKTHLRSEKEVRGYEIQAKDGTLGRVDDFLTDDESWAIRYIIVDTRKWLPGRKVLISPEWAQSVDWKEMQLTLDMTKEQVRKSPEYDPDQGIERDYDIILYNYYGFPPRKQ